MHTHPIRFSVRVLLLLAALSAPSRPAASAPATGADAAQEADAQFQRGKLLYKSGNKREAYEALTAAWALKKSYDIASNLGSVELTLGKARDAAEHFAYAIRTFPATGSKKQLGQVKKLFDDARTQVGALVIKVSVEGAEVLVDGKAVGRAPLADEVYVDPGARSVEARLGGYETATQAVQVATGPVQEVTVALVSVAAGVVGAPRAAVDAGVGETREVALPLNKKEGPVVPPPLVVERRPLWPVVVGGVLAVGGLAAGAGLTVAANGKASDVAMLQAGLHKSGGHYPCAGVPAPNCTILRDTAARQQFMSDAAFTSFLAGGTLALATVGLGAWTVLKPKDSQPSLGLAPMAGAGATGVVVVGQW